MTTKGGTMSTDSISVAEFKCNADAWLDRLQDQEALVLTLRGQGRVVLMSLDRYRQTQTEYARMLQGIGANPDASRTGRRPTIDASRETRKPPAKRKSKRA